MSENLLHQPGFFGKVRTHGDFVSRRLPAEFMAPWDAGLQEGMLLARQRFGAQWLPLYLNTPVWCFALGPHLYGPTAWAGVWMPGVDRVGRYFPFTIAQAFEGVDLGRQLADAQEWYDRLTGLALATLTREFALDEFDAAVRTAGLSSGNHELAPWRLVVPEAAGEGFAAMLIKAAMQARCVWWSDGSSALPPSARISAGATSGLQFASLLDRGADEWDSVIELTSNAAASD
jgi:type VI secretion system protein ImpM